MAGSNDNKRYLLTDEKTKYFSVSSVEKHQQLSQTPTLISACNWFPVFNLYFSTFSNSTLPISPSSDKTSIVYSLQSLRNAVHSHLLNFLRSTSHRDGRIPAAFDHTGGVWLVIDGTPFSTHHVTGRSDLPNNVPTQPTI